MTLSAYAEELGARLPSVDEKAAARQLCDIITSRRKLQLILPDRQSAEITLTPALTELLTDLLEHIASGDAVTLVPVTQMLTTQQAADILNVSRPHLISLIEKGLIPCSHVGRHRRIKAEDLFAYRDSRNETRAKALSDLAEVDAGLL